MSEVKFKNDNMISPQVKPLKTGGSPSYGCSQLNPIYNYNGYMPTYQQPYYTTNYGYQMPQVYAQYPTAQVAAPQVVTAPKITPGATIDAAGTKCEIPPGTSGLNIIINSPTVATPGYHPMINTNTNCIGGNGSGTANASASANAGNNAAKKTKNVVALTDDYIKNLENYLRNPDRKMKLHAIKEVANRFIEDDKRKTNQPLNALLNLALQAKEPEIRLVALGLLKQGYAGGNDVTVQILNNLQQSAVCKGEEAADAKKAVLKMSETVVKIPDNSPDKPQKTKEDK